MKRNIFVREEESEKSCFVYFELLPTTFIYFVTFISSLKNGVLP